MQPRYLLAAAQSGTAVGYALLFGSTLALALPAAVVACALTAAGAPTAQIAVPVGPELEGDP